ncbi:MAG: NIPSNAP family protein [Acidobacteria bacterium]|nr:NIPSNAP family protein [Acidobacteriota bacterium]MBI3426617.1 NIPSNAP family protein [Acidobacteriota bacterium]
MLFLALLVAAGSCAALAQTGTQSPAAQPAPTPTLAPSPSLAKDSRYFEMRTYYAAPGKLEALHARFRDHTVKLFKKHGMQIVGFWGPTEKESGSENTLIYMLAYPSPEARAAAWKAFGADPEWQAARKKSEENGKLVDKVVSVFMLATDYSALK